MILHVSYDLKIILNLYDKIGFYIYFWLTYLYVIEWCVSGARVENPSNNVGVGCLQILKRTTIELLDRIM